MDTAAATLMASLETSRAALRAAVLAVESAQAAAAALQSLTACHASFMQDLHNTQKPKSDPPIEAEALAASPAPPLPVLNAAGATLPGQSAPATPLSAADSPSPPEPNDPQLAPLSAERRAELHAALSCLNKEQLAAFIAAFREAFAVPSSIRTIRDRITQQHHADWIEHYLDRLQEGGAA